MLPPNHMKPPSNKKRPLTPLALMLLSVFFEGSTHPYDVLQTLNSRHEDRVVKLNPGTVYHTISRLEAAGLLEQSSTDKCGNRPERTTYSITGKGKCLVLGQLKKMLRKPVQEYPQFPVALAQAYFLDRDVVRELLHERLEYLQNMVEDINEDIDEATEAQAPRLFLIDSYYLRDHLRFQIEWIRSLLDELTAGRLDWEAVDRTDFYPYITSNGRTQFT